jgi:hypothetical protein
VSENAANNPLHRKDATCQGNRFPAFVQFVISGHQASLFLAPIAERIMLAP